MSLIALRDVSLAFGGPPLLDGASVAIARGERVALVGRNGAGKTTLMRVLDGTIAPDGGEVVRQGDVRVARLEQDIPDTLAGTNFDVVAQGLGDVGALIARYHAASHRAAGGGDAALKELDRLHRALDAADAWSIETRVTTALQQLALDPDADFSAASGGRKRQALLARAIVSDPDVLLLDEPTNHLDIEAIEWTERFLVERGVTLLFVTHDRAFLRRVATRILELDRGTLADWGSDYDVYLARKADALHAESKEWAEFDRVLAKEETWIRTGIQARRTRNEGRVRQLEQLRRERADRRERVGNVRMSAQEAERSGRLVVEARDVSFARERNGTPYTIVRGLSTTITRGDRVGLIGPNGSGKTTVLRLLLGELMPDTGTVRHGTNLEIAYFDQLREQLDPERTVFDSIADGADFVRIGGAERHVNGYLGDFLFPANRAKTPVRALSGGERNRLLLARLFTRTFNVLVLDEPTNDLDIETLELLEGLLVEFGGTLVIVSHDREFLDNTVTSTLVLEGGGRIGEYAGGYTDWIRQRPASAGAPAPRPQKPIAPPAKPERRKKLSMREAKELDELPDRISGLEASRDALFASLSDPAVRRDAAAVLDANARLARVEQEIASATERWETLYTQAEA